MKGFFEGVGVVVVLVILFSFPTIALYYLKGTVSNTPSIINVLFWLFNVFLIGYLVNKYKLPKGFIVVGIIFNVLFLPFLFAYIESIKAKANKKNRGIRGVLQR